MSAKACDGCAKPFSVVRRPRFQGYQTFTSTEAETRGRTGVVPLTLCGRCRDDVQANGGRVWSLPALEKAAGELETLTLANAEGSMH